MKRFQELSRELLNRKANIHKKSDGSYEARIYVKEYLSEFSELNFHFSDISRIPNWITSDMNNFGAYLAGVIDGDGCVLIKRPKYSQCLVRIKSGIKSKKLKDYIIKNFNCGANIQFEQMESILDGRKIIGKCYKLEFHISSKNSDLVKEYILSWIAMPHKKQRIERFLKTRKYIKRIGPMV